MAYSVYTLSNRISALESLINSGSGTINTLQQVVSANDSLNGSPPTTAGQVIQFDGTVVKWDTVSQINPTLQDVLTSSNITDLPAVFEDAPFTSVVAPAEIFVGDTTNTDKVSLSSTNITLNQDLGSNLVLTAETVDQNGTSVPWSQILSSATTIPSLSDVLGQGNSAGTFNLDMNTNDILQVGDINVVSINGSAYPPFVTPDTLQQVLGQGNSAGTFNINMNANDILNCDNLQVTTINSAVYPPVIASDTIQQVLTAGNNAIDKTMGLQSNTSNTNSLLSNNGVDIQGQNGTNLKRNTR
jgi:hypothetical protein